MDIELKIQKNVPLAPFTTYKIGGSAQFYLEINCKDDLLQALEWAKVNKKKFFILGGGSNVLVNDAGVSGLVLKMNNTTVKVMGERLECGAGASLSRVNSLAMNQNLSGFEWSSGIPRATVGGSVRGNAGAFGVESKDLVETVEIFDLKRGEFGILSNKMCNFSYRSSIFKEKNNFIIWSVTFKLKSDEKKDIDSRLEKTQSFRREKYPQLPSAGSVFENLDAHDLERANPIFFEKELKDKIGREGKISAGLIIDLAGYKGKTVGGIKVSLEHANHIVNTGNGTAKDVRGLINEIKKRIFMRFKIELKEEIKYFGFE